MGIGGARSKSKLAARRSIPRNAKSRINKLERNDQHEMEEEEDDEPNAAPSGDPINLLPVSWQLFITHGGDLENGLTVSYITALTNGIQASRCRPPAGGWFFLMAL